VKQQVLGENPLARRRDSVFRNTEQADVLSTAQVVEMDTTSVGEKAADNRVQFVLSRRHLQILDDVCYEVRRVTGYKLNRSEVVRSIIEYLGKKEVLFQSVRSEEDFGAQFHAILNS
jgi:hypothetical protein